MFLLGVLLTTEKHHLVPFCLLIFCILCLSIQIKYFFFLDTQGTELKSVFHLLRLFYRYVGSYCLRGQSKWRNFFSFAWDFPRFFAVLFMRSLKYYVVIIPYRSDSLSHGLYHIIDHKMFKALQSNHSTATRCSAHS